MAFDRSEVVRVPFPFSDRQAVRHRPALVLSDKDHFNDAAGHAVMAMITSASHSPFPLDSAISDLASAGLPRASKVRFKLFTLDRRLVRGRLGRLGADDELAVRRALASVMPCEHVRPVRGQSEPPSPGPLVVPGSEG